MDTILTPRAKTHHIVPRRYLKLFADSRERVKVQHCHGGTFVSNVANVAAENHFYSVSEIDGQKSDAMEVALSKWEEELFPGISEISNLSGPLSADGRERAALWMSMQHLRSRPMRELSQRIGESVIANEGLQSTRAQRIQQLRKESPDLSAHEAKKIVEEAYSLVVPQMVNYVNSAEFQAQGLDNYVHTIANELLSRRWIVVQFCRKSLATSDDPVNLLSDSVRNFGVKPAESITFPVSRKVALILRKERGGDKLIQGTTQLAKSLNQETIRRAHRIIVFHPQDESQIGLLL